MKEFDFNKYLEDYVKNYDGKYSILIRNVPNIYSLTANLLDDVDLNFNLRRDIYVAIGYLFHPSDIFPEDKHGSYGFIEDIMVLLFVCIKVEKKHSLDFLKIYWKSDDSLESIMDEYDNVIKEEEELFLSTLKVTGFVDESF